MNRLTLTAMVALFTATSVSADLPLPPDYKYVSPRVRFAGVEKYKDYVFYVKLNTGAGNPNAAPPVRFEVKDAESFTLAAQRHIANMYLLAVKVEEFKKLQDEDKTLKSLTEKTPGVLAAALTAPSTVGKVKDKEVPVTEYTVSITDGKLNVAMVKKDKRQSSLTPDGEMRPWVVGLACALSLALFGVWFARRRHGNGAIG